MANIGWLIQLINMNLTYLQLHQIMPLATKTSIQKYLPWLNNWMPYYGITTPVRVRHFLAQVAHESGQLRYNKELASGASYDTGRLAIRLGNTPEDDGDGERLKGRGLIQITGTNNYKLLSKDWGIDVFANPNLLLTPSLATRSACWFWWKNGLNHLVDDGATVSEVTKVVNGGHNGLPERIEFYNNAKRIIV